METRYPPDRFDTVPDDLLRVGAHRSPVRRGRGWIAFAWAALATGALVALGIIGLSLFSDSITNIDLPFTSAAPDQPSPTPSVEETAAAPVLDPAISITVLNGTTTTGLANLVGNRLVAEGWCGAAVGGDVPSDGPCSSAVGSGSRINAAANDIESTVVFYLDPANEGAARALVQALGVGEIRLSEDYPTSPITILLGSDYVPPVG